MSGLRPLTMSSSTRRIGTALAVLALPLALSACSSSSSSSSTTKAAGAGTSTSASGNGGSSTVDCNLVTPAEVNAALGTSVGAPSSIVNGSVTVCTYKQSAGTVIVRFDTDSSASKFAEAKAGFGSHGETAVTASGFGDEAYTSSLGAGNYTTSTIVARKGSTELLITGPATIAQVEALATQVLAKL